MLKGESFSFTGGILSILSVCDSCLLIPGNFLVSSLHHLYPLLLLVSSLPRHAGELICSCQYTLSHLHTSAWASVST